MTIDQDIARVGGVEPVSGSAFRAMTESEINEIAALLGQPLPPAYADFLRRFGACRFRQLVSFAPQANTPLYQHPPETGLRNYAFKGSLVAHFYGADDGDENTLSLKRILKTYARRMPPGFIPIADDGMGNQICLACDPEHREHVYFWDHENEWDEEDYADDVGAEMPAEARFQNVYPLAGSFAGFFSILTLSC